jgi:hypothetical protein
MESSPLAAELEDRRATEVVSYVLWAVQVHSYIRPKNLAIRTKRRRKDLRFGVY